MSGIDIVLNTIFNNPSLPTVPVYGFSDDFERANGPVGVTSREAKPWIEHVYPGSDVQAVIDGGKLKATGSTFWKVLAVDAKSPNGTFRAAMSNIDANGGLRVALRVTNATNFLYIRLVAGVIRLETLIGGTGTVIASSAPITEYTNGVFEVVLDGPLVSVKWNGAEVIPPQTVTDMSGNTQHGFMLRSESPNTRVDSASFQVA